MPSYTQALLLLTCVATTSCAKDRGQIDATGTVEFTSVDVVPIRTARIVQLKVAEGERVSAGDTVAILNSPTLSFEIRELEAALGQAAAEQDDVRRGPRPEVVRQAAAALSAASVSAAHAAANMNRMTAMAEHGDISAQQYDALQAEAARTASLREQAQHALALLDAGSSAEALRIAAANRSRARARVDAARAVANDLVLLAPLSGVVTATYAEVGELASAGRALVTIANPDAPWVRVYVNQTVLPALQLRQRATARLDGADADEYASQITSISTEAEYTPRIALTEDERADQMFGIRLALIDPQHRLKAGLPITVRFVPARDSTAQLPRMSLVGRAK
jgi:HlyD family secretion protein